MREIGAVHGAQLEPKGDPFRLLLRTKSRGNGHRNGAATVPVTWTIQEL